jgi:hypothetical protein
VGSVVGEDGVDLVGGSGDQAAQEVRGGAAGHLLMQFDEGEFRRPVDRDKEIELALSGSDLGEVDMEIVDRIGLELALRRSFAFDLRQARDPVALKASIKGRARQMRDCRLKRVEAVVERQQRVCLRKATTTASSSTVRTVDRGSFGPVRRSATDLRAFHFAMVFGLTP